jgi:hypothetical protein
MIPEHEKHDSATSATARSTDIKDESLWGLLTTTTSYVVNDMRKKQRQFIIGVMTIFLVVAFVTFLDSMVSVVPAVFFMASQQSSGDFDI